MYIEIIYMYARRHSHSSYIHKRIRFSSFSYHFSCPWAQTKRQNTKTKKNKNTTLTATRRKYWFLFYASVCVCLILCIYIFIKAAQATSFLSLSLTLFRYLRECVEITEKLKQNKQTNWNLSSASRPSLKYFKHVETIASKMTETRRDVTRRGEKWRVKI